MTNWPLFAETDRKGWQTSSGYNKRAKVEAAIGRWKPVIGNGLLARKDDCQATEVEVAVHVLNRMLALGRPSYARIAWPQNERGVVAPIPTIRAPCCRPRLRRRRPRSGGSLTRPIRRELWALYPAVWRAISDEVRFGQAGRRCQHWGRPHIEAAIGLRTTRVVLATAHLDYNSRNDHRRSLRALCQRCT